MQRRLKALEASHADRQSSKKRIIDALAMTEHEVAAFVQKARTTSVKTVHNYTAHTSNYVSSTLEAGRGYSTKPGTTPGHIVSVS
jgi:hypothetical protein